MWYQVPIPNGSANYSVLWFTLFCNDTSAQSSGFYPAFIVVYCIELINLLFGVVSIGFCIVAIIRIRILHFNLSLMIIAVIAQYYLSIIARVILFCIQVEWIGEETTSWWYVYLIAASFIRLYFLGFCLATAVTFIFERLVATWLIRDYELKNRSWVCTTTIFFNFICGVALAITLIAVYIDVLIVFFICTIPALVCVTAFLCLFWANKRHLRSINRGYCDEEYTLSIRFQLEENVRALRLLRNLVLISCSGIFVIGILYLSVSYYEKNVNKYIGELGMAIFDAVVALFVNILFLLGICSVDQYKIYLRNTLRQIFVCFHCFGNAEDLNQIKKTVDQNATLHFEQLDKFWNIGPAPSKRGGACVFYWRKQRHAQKFRPPTRKAWETEPRSIILNNKGKGPP